MKVEEEVLLSRRAFPQTQILLAGSPTRRVGKLSVGWHGAAIHPETGAIALVRTGGPYEDLVGEYLIVTQRDTSIFVYCYGRINIPTDLSLTRRSFLALDGLYREKITCTVEVRA